MNHISIVLLIVFVLAGGCKTIPNYSVSINNVAKTTIDNSNVHYKEFSFSGGMLPPGIWKYHGLVQFPIPDIATVEWTTKDGGQHRKDIILESVPKDFSGEIRFEIDDSNNVTFRTIDLAPD